MKPHSLQMGVAVAVAALCGACAERSDLPTHMPAADDVNVARAAGSQSAVADDAGFGFEGLPPQTSGDWLTLHPEPGQTFAEFERTVTQRPTADRRTIYLVFVRAWPRDATPELAVLATFVRAYFGLPVRVIGVATMRAIRFHAGRLRTALVDRLPKDAFALIAITDADLLSASSTAVFGEASAARRVGIVSVARLHLGFYVARARSDRRIVLRRTLALLAHELGHLFGIEHCTAYRCVMNGVATLSELDSLPAHVCPVDLHKLLATAGFDLAARYRRLAGFYRAHGLDSEADWTAARARAW